MSGGMIVPKPRKNQKGWLPPEEFHCKRKTKYPLKSMADAAAALSSKNDNAKITSYLCNYCGKYHIGHDPNAYEKPKPYAGSKYFAEFAGLILAKVKNDFDQYVFAVPADIAENDQAVLDHGVLIAYKKGTDVFREKGGIKSQHWQIFASIFPFYANELITFAEKIADHEEFMEDFQKVQMDFLNKVPVPSLTERIKAHTQKEDEAKMQRDYALRKLEEEKRLVEQQEMHGGRAVFRDEQNKPFHRDIYTCCNDGCEEEIELRAYIHEDASGRLTSTMARRPVNSLAVRKPGSSVQKPEWVCGKCMEKATKKEPEAVEETEVVAAEPSQAPAPTMSKVMAELQRITFDPHYDSEFVRGAMMMAFTMVEASQC